MADKNELQEFLDRAGLAHLWSRLKEKLSGKENAGAAADVQKNLTNHNTDTAAHSDLRLELKALADRINAALDSDDETLDELSEIVAYIKSNKELIEAITTSKVSVSDIVNDLVTNVANKPLSAAQGVALKKLIDDVTAEQVGAVPTSRKVNGKALSDDIALTAGDVEIAEALAAAYGLPEGASTEDVLQRIIDLDVSATEETLPVALKYRSIAYGAGKFVAVAYDSNTIVYSEDGVTWETATLPISKSWYSVAYGGGAFVAVAYGGTSAVRSTDGVTWEETTLPYYASWCAITYGNGRFVAISGHASTYRSVAISTDGGVTWESATLPSASKWRVVAYGAGKFVAISGDGAVAAISADGKTWEEITLPVSEDWISVAYGNGMFIAIASNSATAISSADGRTWKTITLPGSYSWAAIAYGDGKFVAAGYTSKIYYSTDGLTWGTAASLGSTRDIAAVAYGAGKFVAIEDEETAAHCITIANALGLDRFAKKSEVGEQIGGVYIAMESLRSDIGDINSILDSINGEVV